MESLTEKGRADRVKSVKKIKELMDSLKEKDAVVAGMASVTEQASLQRIDEWKAKIAAAEEERDFLLKRESELAAALQLKTENAENDTQRIDQLKTKLTELMQTARKMSSEKSNIAESLEKAQEELISRNEQVVTLKSDLCRLELATEAWKAERDRLEETLNDLQRDLLAARDELQQVHSENRSQAAQLLELSESVKDKEQAIEERDGMVASYKDHVESLDEQVSTLRMQVVQLEDQLAARQLECADSIALVASLQAQVDAASKVPREFDILLRVEAGDQTWCQLRYEECTSLLAAPYLTTRSYAPPSGGSDQHMCVVWKTDSEVLVWAENKEVDNSGGFSIGDWHS